MARVDVYFITGLTLLALGILVNVIISAISINDGIPYQTTVPLYYYFIPTVTFILGIVTLQRDKK